MKTIISRAHVYGDNIDSDRILPGKYTKILDLQQLTAHVFEDVDINFVSKVQRGDILVAGENFACGSSREQAPLALKNIGIAAVVVNSCSRIFFRNAINLGLPIFIIGPHNIADKSEIEIEMDSGQIKDLTNQRIYQASKLPPVMLDIFHEGGLVAYLRKYGNYHSLTGEKTS